jgi:hypothetical protein
MAEHSGSQVRASDRLAGLATRGEHAVVDRVAHLLEQIGHASRAGLAVLAGAAQALEQPRVVVVDAIAKYVQVLVAGVDRRDLSGREQPDAVRCGGGKRIIDTVDGVVVAEREQLDSRRRRGRYDIRDGKIAVGMARVRLEVDPLHGRGQLRPLVITLHSTVTVGLATVAPPSLRGARGPRRRIAACGWARSIAAATTRILRSGPVAGRVGKLGYVRAPVVVALCCRLRRRTGGCAPRGAFCVVG